MFNVGQKLEGMWPLKYAIAISPDAMKAAMRVWYPTRTRIDVTASMRPAAIRIVGQGVAHSRYRCWKLQNFIVACSRKEVRSQSEDGQNIGCPIVEVRHAVVSSYFSFPSGSRRLPLLSLCLLQTDTARRLWTGSQPLLPGKAAPAGEEQFEGL